MGMTWVVRHSKETEASPTRGALTTRLGAGVRPAWWNSDSPWASDSPVFAIPAAYDSSATFTTNSPTPPSSTNRALRRVSLMAPSGFRPPTVKARLKGVWLATVKYENGATFGRPSTETVETTAIGRGTTHPITSL